MVSNDEMALMKVVRFEKTSIKIVSAKSQVSKIENGFWGKMGQIPNSQMCCSKMQHKFQSCFVFKCFFLVRQLFSKTSKINFTN